jgi:hypothetical protein
LGTLHQEGNKLAIYNTAVRTTLGEDYDAAVNANLFAANYTKIAVSSRVYAENELKNLTELEEIRITAPKSGVWKNSSASVTISASYTNIGVTTPFPINTIALYALHPEFGEILHSVQTAEIPDVLPADDGTNLVAETFNFQIWEVNADSTDLFGDPAGLVTLDMLDEYGKRPNHHICDIFVSKGECFHNWELYTSENTLTQPPDELLFKNAFLTKIPLSYTFDLNINKLSLYAPREYMGNWNAEKDLYTDGLYLLNSGNKSMILTGR